jgi:acylphosphatase
MACAKFIVSGHVQGVFFRASARDEALRLELTGHARNLSDGSVEVVACGSEEALASLERWLQRGPPLAQVSSVERSAVDEQPRRRFDIA